MECTPGVHSFLAPVNEERAPFIFYQSRVRGTPFGAKELVLVLGAPRLFECYVLNIKQ